MRSRGRAQKVWPAAAAALPTSAWMTRSCACTSGGSARPLWESAGAYEGRGRRKRQSLAHWSSPSSPPINHTRAQLQYEL